MKKSIRFATATAMVFAMQYPAFAQTAKTSTTTPASTTAKPQLGTYGFDTAGMDQTVKPGDEFYDHANGGWARSHPIPADKSSFGMFTVLDDMKPEDFFNIITFSTSVNKE